jgi:hypothetical protein
MRVRSLQMPSLNGPKMTKWDQHTTEWMDGEILLPVLVGHRTSHSEGHSPKYASHFVKNEIGHSANADDY